MDKKKTNTILIIISIVLLVAGIVLLSIEPIKSLKREKITNDALSVVQSDIELSLNASEITIIVPRDGNEVAGESYDYYGEDEEAILAMQQEIEENEKNLPENITLTCAGILRIDDIELELPVWTESTRIALRYGLGIYDDTYLPGNVGNSTILGHRNQHTNTMFYRLKEVETGDTVYFTGTDGHELLFIVDEIKIVSSEELMQYINGDITDTVQLTLVTCANGERGYGEGYRRLVICHMSQED
ncbi:MAG: sortase [Saccharofermentans sp.]|nr:sortase [Saccharofermentans sp.]